MLLDLAHKEVRQLFKGSLRLRQIVSVAIRHGPPVKRAVINFALIPAAPLRQRFIEFVDRFLRHGAILRCVTEVEECLHAWDNQMRTRRLVREKTAAMERCRYADSVWASSSGAQRHRARKTIPNHADRSGSDRS